MISPIKYKVDWGSMRQQKKMHMNKDNIRKNSEISDHEYKVKDTFMIADNDAFKYETPYKVLFDITQC